ncbi:MAG: hypothetical protein ACRDQB_16165, partial [Thermocrispum sp.]
PYHGGKSDVVASPGTTTLTVAPGTSERPSVPVERKPDRPPVQDTEPSDTGEVSSEELPPPESPSVEPSGRAQVPMTAGGPIGPDGWADLKLGMSFQDAKAAGYIPYDAPPPQDCTSYSLTTGSEFVSAVLISSESGVGRIVAAQGGRSPQNMGIGSPVEDLHREYPDGDEAGGEFRAQAVRGAEYVFALPSEDAVARGFALTNGGC